MNIPRSVGMDAGETSTRIAIEVSAAILENTRIAIFKIYKLCCILKIIC
jgi:hypothetical protein